MNEAMLAAILLVAVAQCAALVVLARREPARPSCDPAEIAAALRELLRDRGTDPTVDEADGVAMGRHKHKYPPELVINDPENGVAVWVCRCGARSPRRLGA